MNTKRRIVWLVRGRSFLTSRGAYRREALRQLLDECAVTCEVNEDYDGHPVKPPCHKSCSCCGDRPSDAAVNDRAGQLYETDFGVKS